MSVSGPTTFQGPFRQAGDILWNCAVPCQRLLQTPDVLLFSQEGH